MKATASEDSIQPTSEPAAPEMARTGLPSTANSQLHSESISPEQLAELFAEFSQTTQRLQESHSVLQQRVVSLRNELAEKNLQLERKKRLEGLGLMVAGVAHEIRNPLGSIALYLDSLVQEVRGEFSSSSCLDLISRIDHVVAHLNGVVENMLVFTSSIEVKREECDLPMLLSEALQLMVGEIDRSNTRIIHSNNPPFAKVLADRDRIRCVFINLIKNAIQAMEPGGEIHIDWSSVQRDGEEFIRVAVRDTGPGIPQENLEKVLVPFFSEGKSSGGVGLGLTLVHTILERQGGRVKLMNSEDGGLVVELEFRKETKEGAQS